MEHRSGLKCDLRSCKKVFYAKNELEAHKKQANTSLWRTKKWEPENLITAKSKDN